MRTRRRAAVSSFGSRRSWELTSMIKADVTAENRPACGASQPTCIRATCTTHEYQRCVQILIVSLVELPVILLGHFTVIFVESRAAIPRVRAHVFLLTVDKVSVTSRWAWSGYYPSPNFPSFDIISSSFSTFPESSLRSGVSQKGCH